MNPPLVLLAALAFVHVARPDAEVAADQSVAKSDSCSANGQTYQPGERFCAGKTVTAVCSWGGEVFKFDCPDGFECQTNSNRQVQCFKFNTIAPYPTGPPGGFEIEPQPQPQPQSQPQAQPQPQPQPQPPPQPQEKPVARPDPGFTFINERHRRLRRQEGGSGAPPAAVPPPKTSASDTCNVNGQTYQPGDRFCVSKTTNAVCSWGGEVVKFECDAGSECQVLASNSRQVQCLKFVTNAPYPTGPPAGFENSEPQPQSPPQPQPQSQPQPQPQPQSGAEQQQVQEAGTEPQTQPPTQAQTQPQTQPPTQPQTQPQTPPPAGPTTGAPMHRRH